MNETSKNLSIIAFYFSEYSETALQELGYSTYKQAFSEISALFGRDNNYLKLRRDEFDALPESKSSRVGWHKRMPIKTVVDMGEYLRQFSFEDLTEVVKKLILNTKTPYQEEMTSSQEVDDVESIEDIINRTDATATIQIRTADMKVRKYDISIVNALKKLYKGRCQICGCACGEEQGVSIVHAHHIVPFSKSQNNNAGNIMILCPNHHAIIHAANAVFDNKDMAYRFPNGTVAKLLLNYHL